MAQHVETGTRRCTTRHSNEGDLIGPTIMGHMTIWTVLPSPLPLSNRFDAFSNRRCASSDRVSVRPVNDWCGARVFIRRETRRRIKAWEAVRFFERISPEAAMSSTGIAVGLNKGYPVTKKEVAPRPAARKGRLGKKTKLVRSIVREVVGLMPYEKRILDMIKSGGSSAEKRIYKFSKKRLGTHRRALQKREEMKAYYAALRAKQATH